MPTDLVLTRRTQRTRDKLLRVARAVFEADGYDGASVARIVEDADVSRGTFYLYFESKEDIFRTLATALQEGILHAQEWPADAPPEEIVRAATSAFLTLLPRARPADGRARAGRHVRRLVPVDAPGDAPRHGPPGPPLHHVAAGAGARPRRRSTPGTPPSP